MILSHLLAVGVLLKFHTSTNSCRKHASVRSIPNIAKLYQKSVKLMTHLSAKIRSHLIQIASRQLSGKLFSTTALGKHAKVQSSLVWMAAHLACSSALKSASA